MKKIIIILFSIILVGSLIIGNPFKDRTELFHREDDESVLFLGWQIDRTITEIDIPKGVTTVGDNAFANCENLSYVNFPNSLSRIGRYAFQYCTSLESITLPEGLQTIGTYAFKHCESLVSIEIPANVNYVSDRAFSDCYALETVTFKGKPSRIHDNVFINCNSLKTIYVPWSKGMVNGAPWGADESVQIIYNCQ